MKMAARDLEAAFLVRLLALTPAWTTKRPGLPFKPATNAPWQRGTLMPGTPDTVTIGSGIGSRLFGIYQVDLFYPTKDGSSDGNVDALLLRADAVRDWFFPANRRGLELASGATRAWIEKMPAVSAINEQDPAFNQCSVLIAFRAEDLA